MLDLGEVSEEDKGQQSLQLTAWKTDTDIHNHPKWQVSLMNEQQSKN